MAVQVVERDRASESDPGNREEGLGAGCCSASEGRAPPPEFVGGSHLAWVTCESRPPSPYLIAVGIVIGPEGSSECWLLKPYDKGMGCEQEEQHINRQRNGLVEDRRTAQCGTGAQVHGIPEKLVGAAHNQTTRRVERSG